MRTAMLFSFVSFLGLFALSCKKEKKQNPIHHYRKAKELYEKKTPKALKEARKHLKISCEGKIGAACFNLGMLFHKGEGGKKTLRRRWPSLRRRAPSGNPRGAITPASGMRSVKSSRAPLTLTIKGVSSSLA